MKSDWYLRVKDGSFDVPAWLHMLFLFVLTTVVTSHYSMLGIDDHHDSVMFKPALDIIEGKVLYKETFSLYGTLTVLMQALALYVFGGKLVVLKLFTAVFYGFIVVLLWKVWSGFLPKALNTLSCLMWLFLGPGFIMVFPPWSSVYAEFTLLATLIFIILYLEATQKRWIFLITAGICTSLTFWFKQPAGIYLVIAAAAFIVFDCYLKKYNLLSCLSNLSLFFSGHMIPDLLVFLWLFSNGTVTDWWLQSVYHNYLIGKGMADRWTGFPLKGMVNSLFTITDFVLSGTSFIFSTANSPGRYDRFTWLFFPAIALFIFINELLSLRKTPYGKSADKLFAVLFICFASWMHYYPMAGSHHCYWGATPMMGLSIFFFTGYINKTADGVNSKLKIFRVLLTLFFIFTISQSLYYRISSGIEKSFMTDYSTVTTPEVLKYMKVSPLEKKQLEETDSLLKRYTKGKEHPYLLAEGGGQLIPAFIKNNRNFHPVYFDSHVFFIEKVYPQRKNDLYNFIREQKPLLYTTAVVYMPEGYCPVKRFTNNNRGKITGYLFVPYKPFDKEVFEVVKQEINGVNKVFIKHNNDKTNLSSVYISYNNIATGISSAYIDQTKLTLFLNNKLIPFNYGDLDLNLSEGDILEVQYDGTPGNPFDITFCTESGYYSRVAISR
ncbi:MAG: hypothetical protein H7844_09600 [Nitrospirae bacterium YQR-1]